MPEITNVVSETEEVAVPKAAAPKKAAKKAAKKAEPAKAAAKKAAGTDKKTARLQVFELLKHADGLTGPAIQKALGLSGVPAFLKDECFGAKPRIRRLDVEGVRGVVYQLTAAGKAAVEKGTVDSAAAERTAGQDYPEGR